MILTPEQELIRDSMRAFAQERLAPFAAEWDRNHTFPREALNELAELGALGMVVPEEWGGAGMDYMSLVLTLEEIAAGDGATSTIVSVQNSLPCGIINRFGNDAQKEAWLKPLARGEKLGCFCLTEPHPGRLAEMAERVCSDAIQVHGGYGYVTDFPVERIYRDVRVCQIYEGASDIQKLVVGRALTS